MKCTQGLITFADSYASLYPHGLTLLDGHGVEVQFAEGGSGLGVFVLSHYDEKGATVVDRAGGFWVSPNDTVSHNPPDCTDGIERAAA